MKDYNGIGSACHGVARQLSEDQRSFWVGDGLSLVELSSEEMGYGQGREEMGYGHGRPVTLTTELLIRDLPLLLRHRHTRMHTHSMQVPIEM